MKYRQCSFADDPDGVNVEELSDCSRRQEFTSAMSLDDVLSTRSLNRGKVQFRAPMTPMNLTVALYPVELKFSLLTGIITWNLASEMMKPKDRLPHVNNRCSGEYPTY